MCVICFSAPSGFLFLCCLLFFVSQGNTVYLEEGRVTSKMTAFKLLSSVLMLLLVQSGVFCARRFRGGRNPQPRRAPPPPPPPPTHRAGDRGDAAESFPLDFTAVGENMDNFMTQVKNLAQSLYPCSAQKLDHDMKLNFLENTSVTCNDGSSAGYVLSDNNKNHCD